jgi:hypothetical protein
LPIGRSGLDGVPPALVVRAPRSAPCVCQGAAHAHLRRSLEPDGARAYRFVVDLSCNYHALVEFDLLSTDIRARLDTGAEHRFLFCVENREQAMRHIAPEATSIPQLARTSFLEYLAEFEPDMLGEQVQQLQPQFVPDRLVFRRYSPAAVVTVDFCSDESVQVAAHPAHDSYYFFVNRLSVRARSFMNSLLAARERIIWSCCEQYTDDAANEMAANFSTHLLYAPPPQQPTAMANVQMETE